MNKMATNGEYLTFISDGGYKNFRHWLSDGWDWINANGNGQINAYLPYPFYQAPEGAVGEYNGKFMINQMALRGGLCVTAKEHIRSTYRNFFYPHMRWMFSRVRLAKSYK